MRRSTPAEDLPRPEPPGTVIRPYPCEPPACVEYDPRAAEVAQRVADMIWAHLPTVTVEHIGSTAVPGCAGKGIVDLMIAYADGELPAVKEVLRRLGFQPQVAGHLHPEERPMRVGVLEHEGRPFRVHAHVIAASSEEAADLRAFRDRLCSAPDLVAAYVAHKRRIIAAGVTDPTAYTCRKGSFIEDVLAAIHRERSSAVPCRGRPPSRSHGTG